MIENPLRLLIDTATDASLAPDCVLDMDCEDVLPAYGRTFTDEMATSVPKEEHQALSDILLMHSSVFSQNEVDLGRATEDKHRNDAGINEHSARLCGTTFT